MPAAHRLADAGRASWQTLPHPPPQTRTHERVPPRRPPMAWGQTTPLVLPSHSGLPSGVWGALPFLCVQHNSPTPLLSFVWNRTCLLCAFVDAAAVAQPTGGTSGGAAAIATWTAATAVKAAAATFATGAAAAASAVAAGQRHRLAQRREPGPRAWQHERAADGSGGPRR